MSKYIHDMKLGDTLSVKGPIPKFDFKGKFSFSLAWRELTRVVQLTSLTRSA